MAKLGKIYIGKLLNTKSRKKLLATIRPNHRQYLRPDTGYMPEGCTPPLPKAEQPDALHMLS